MEEMLSKTNITEELRTIRKELNFIKEHMIDADTFLTPKEEELFEKSLDEYKKKEETISLEEFEKELEKNI